MKKVLLGMMALLGFLATQASHIVGGQITATALNNQRLYSIEMKLYRDNTGITLNSTESITIVGNGAIFTLPIAKPTPTLIWGTATKGVEEYIFQSNYQFPGPGKYKIYYQNCCRNAGIRNTQSTPGFYIESEILVDSTMNSTPNFLNQPFALAIQNVQWNHNPIPYDIDGDSLSWSIDTPREYLSGVVAVPNYFNPDSDPGYLFAMDSYSGVISWQPTMIARYIASVLLKEYRNGVQIGSIRRDYQFLVDTMNNSVPNFTGNAFGPKVGNNYQVSIPSGNTYQVVFDVTCGVGDSVAVKAIGEPFKAANPPVVLTNQISKTRFQTNMTWNTNKSNARTKPYITVFTAATYKSGAPYYQTDITVLYSVQKSTAVKNISNNQWEVYPNPTHDQPIMIHLSDLNIGMVSIEMIDLMGRSVYHRNFNQTTIGTTTYMVQPDFTPGTYILKVSQGNQSMTQKVVIQ